MFALRVDKVFIQKIGMAVMFKKLKVRIKVGM